MATVGSGFAACNAIEGIWAITCRVTALLDGSLLFAIQWVEFGIGGHQQERWTNEKVNTPFIAALLSAWFCILRVWVTADSGENIWIAVLTGTKCAWHQPQSHHFWITYSWMGRSFWKITISSEKSRQLYLSILRLHPFPHVSLASIWILREDQLENET